MKKLRFIPCFVALIASFPGVATADFKYIQIENYGSAVSGGSPQVSQGLICQSNVLTIIGNDTPGKVNGFGTGLPLKTAVRMLVPAGWQIDARRGVNMETPVSWRADQAPWTDALREALKSAGMTGSVSMTDFTVVINPHVQNCVKPVAAYSGQFNLAPGGQAAPYSTAISRPPRGVNERNNMNESGDAR